MAGLCPVRGGFCRIFAPCALSFHSRCSLGQLSFVCRRRVFPRYRVETRVWPPRTISRQDPRSGAQSHQPSRHWVVLLLHLLRSEAIAAVNRSAAGWTKSAGLFPSRCQSADRHTGCATHYASARLTKTSQRSIADFLPRLLVTVLQLRVTGHPGAS